MTKDDFDAKVTEVETALEEIRTNLSDVKFYDKEDETWDHTDPPLDDNDSPIIPVDPTDKRTIVEGANQTYTDILGEFNAQTVEYDSKIASLNADIATKRGVTTENPSQNINTINSTAEKMINDKVDIYNIQKLNIFIRVVGLAGLFFLFTLKNNNLLTNPVTDIVKKTTSVLNKK